MNPNQTREVWRMVRKKQSSELEKFKLLDWTKTSPNRRSAVVFESKDGSSQIYAEVVSMFGKDKSGFHDPRKNKYLVDLTIRSNGEEYFIYKSSVRGNQDKDDKIEKKKAIVSRKLKKILGLELESSDWRSSIASSR